MPAQVAYVPQFAGTLSATQAQTGVTTPVTPAPVPAVKGPPPSYYDLVARRVIQGPTPAQGPPPWVAYAPQFPPTHAAAPPYSPLMAVAKTPNPPTAPTPWAVPPGTWRAPSTSATSSQQDSSSGMVSMMQQSTTQVPQPVPQSTTQVPTVLQHVPQSTTLAASVTALPSTTAPPGASSTAGPVPQSTTPVHAAGDLVKAATAFNAMAEEHALALPGTTAPPGASSTAGTDTSPVHAPSVTDLPSTTSRFAVTASVPAPAYSPLMSAAMAADASSAPPPGLAQRCGEVSVCERSERLAQAASLPPQVFSTLTLTQQFERVMLRRALQRSLPLTFDMSEFELTHGEGVRAVTLPPPERMKPEVPERRTQSYPYVPLRD